MVREALTLDAIHGLPPDEVAAWFVVRRSEGLTASEEALLAGWLSSDAAHARALDGAARAWNALEAGEGDEILEAMRAHARAAGPAGWRWRPLAAAAAVILAVVTGASMFLTRAPKPGPGTPGSVVAASAAQTSYASGIGEVRTIALPDGSRMILDADSTAIGRFGGAARSVELIRGRAFFTVAHDAARPFTVLAADRRLVDLGTRFDVNLGSQSLTVTLLEGGLAVGPRGGSATAETLAPGQQLVSRLGRDQVSTLGAGAADVAAWRSGVIRFDDQPLAEAVAVMNRYSRERIVIRDPAVGAIRVTGQFRAGNNRAFAETLGELYRLRAHREADGIALTRGG